MTILVAEDDPAVRALLRRVLARRGWSALWASHGPELLAVWTREHPPMILSDVDMASPSDGLTACDEIRRHDPGARIRLMSGGPGNEERVRELGFGPLLAKPFTLAEMNRCLDELALPNPSVPPGRRAS